MVRCPLIWNNAMVDFDAYRVTRFPRSLILVKIVDRGIAREGPR